MLLFGSVLVSSYCLTGLGPAQLRDLARNVGRDRTGRRGRPIARERRSFSQGPGAGPRAWFRDLLAPL